MRNRRVIPNHGGYRKLRSFQLAQLTYDLTVRFCDRYIDRRSRTHDQMVQAARSGVQNIAEGSQASGTSSKFEMKLTSVARASLEELRLDYEDFLRQKDLQVWEREDPRRYGLLDARPRSADDIAAWIVDRRRESVDQPIGQTTFQANQEYSANCALVLIGVACALLDRQIDAQLSEFESRGGFSERLHSVRREKGGRTVRTRKTEGQ